MKYWLLLAAVLTVAASPAPARTEGGAELSFTISGSVVLLGNPLEGPFNVLAAGGGKGPIGGTTIQGFYTYPQAIGTDGSMVGGPSQAALRLEATGDMLLLQVDAGRTGTTVPTEVPGTLTWTQTWRGTVAGGTGRFAGATGTFVKTANGLIVMPGLVSPWEGTITITLAG